MKGRKICRIFRKDAPDVSAVRACRDDANQMNADNNRQICSTLHVGALCTYHVHSYISRFGLGPRHLDKIVHDCIHCLCLGIPKGSDKSGMVQRVVI
jgi:hypothetical protein